MSMITAEVLGIGVDERLVERWRGWFAPPVQPFRTDMLPPQVAAAVPIRPAEPSPEWRDTFFMYGGTWTWLSEAEFTALRPGHQRSLLAVRRRNVRPKSMPVWPSELARTGDHLLFRWVESSVRSSRHGMVEPGIWRRAEPVLPMARRLAGTFAAGSGANCFGTVLAAAGEAEAENAWPVLPEFPIWLDDHTEPVRGTSHDHEPGTVFVWTENGAIAHASVTIGDGWMLSKPSQAWSSPRLVWTVRETVDSWRFPGARLSRYRIAH
jgi:hypothetical protein